MKLMMLMLALSCCSSLALPSNDIQGHPYKGAGDVLERSICSRLREKELCKSSFHCIKNKLCKATCACDNSLTKRACNALKPFCSNKVLAVSYCKLTCGLCLCKLVTALGMQSGAIPNSRITASSSFSSWHAPHEGRLHAKHNPGSWASKWNRVGDWIQVDLGSVATVVGVATQGRYDSYNQWVTGYSLKYSNDGKRFKNYQGGKVFKGNKDKSTVVKNDLYPPIAARYIRLVVKSWHIWSTMRMELYGCKN